MKISLRVRCVCSHLLRRLCHVYTVGNVRFLNLMDVTKNYGVVPNLKSRFRFQNFVRALLPSLFLKVVVSLQG